MRQLTDEKSGPATLKKTRHEHCQDPHLQAKKVLDELQRGATDGHDGLMPPCRVQYKFQLL